MNAKLNGIVLWSGIMNECDLRWTNRHSYYDIDEFYRMVVHFY